MRTAAVLVCAILAGCASYSERQAQAPLLEVASAKAPADYAACLMPKARERWAGYVSIGPDGATQVMTVAFNGDSVAATVTISPEAGGSRISYRPWVDTGKFRAFQGEIAACV